jgi:hypothetical protein
MKKLLPLLPFFIYVIVFTIQLVNISQLTTRLKISHTQTEAAIEQTKLAIKVAKDTRNVLDTCMKALEKCRYGETKYRGYEQGNSDSIYQVSDSTFALVRFIEIK